jgi:hypothetical protein
MAKDETQMYHESSYKKKMHSDSFANMPEEKVMKEYPKADYGLDGDYKDTIEGIDMFAKENAKKIRK